MFEFELSVLAPPEPASISSNKVFFWHLAANRPYFGTNVGPVLGKFGAVQDRNIDLVRIASAVLSADRSATRSGRLSAWNQREIAVKIDVLAVDPWDSVRHELENLLGFLTGDVWYLTFRAEAGTPEQISATNGSEARVVLLSGGADSAIGALVSALDLSAVGGRHVLLSQWSSTNLSPVQTQVAAHVERLVPGVLEEHVKVHHSRGRHAASGAAYGKENSTRSRSLLFIALGLAKASVNSVPLWIPENGYASINPPLSRSRRGSLSTKTTHPKFLADLVSILDKVGAHSALMNPFAILTKGEMYTRVAEALGAQEASTFLSSTVSCSHTGARTYGISPTVSCGVCFGCVLRKASFRASGIADTTSYLTPTGSRQVAWIEDKSVVPAMRDFLGEPFGEQDLARLQIPASLSLESVAALCERGRVELRA